MKVQDTVAGGGAGTTKNNPNFCPDLPFCVSLSIRFIPPQYVAFLGAQLR